MVAITKLNSKRTPDLVSNADDAKVGKKSRSRHSAPTDPALADIARPPMRARDRDRAGGSGGGGGPGSRLARNVRIGDRAINSLQVLLPMGPANQRRAIEDSGGESTVRYWLRESHGLADSSDDFGHQAVQYGGAVCSDYAEAAAGLLLNARPRDPVVVADVSIREYGDHRVALIGDHREIGRENTIVVDGWANHAQARPLSTTSLDPAIVRQYDPSQNAGVSAEQLHNNGVRIPREQVDEFLEGMQLPPIGHELAEEIKEISPPFDYWGSLP